MVSPIIAPSSPPLTYHPLNSDEIVLSNEQENRETSQESEREEEGLETRVLLRPPQAPVTYLTAAKTLLKMSVPLSSSWLGMTIQGIGNGIVARHLSPNEMAAVPLEMALISEVGSILEGILLSTGVFIGNLSGAQNYSQIGAVVTQSWWTGFGLSVPAAILLRNVSNILNATGMREEVVRAVQAYCSAFSYGIVPMCWFTTDLLFAQSIKQPKVVLMANNVRAGLSMLLSYPLALGAFGLPRLGIAGLGYGTSLAAWLSLIGLRLYYKFSGQYDDFELSHWQFPKIKEIAKFLREGLPFGLKEAFDGANALILSLLAGKLGKEVLMAEEVSLVPVSAFSTMLTGLVSATGVEIANSMGTLEAAIARSDYASIGHLQQNVKRFGHTGLIIGLSIALATCLLFTGFSKQISETFIDTSSDVSEETLQLARTLLSINGLGLVIDTVKVLSTNNLLNLQDTLFSSLLNLTTMVLGLSAGAYLSLQANQGATWLFTTQILASLVAALGIAHRWIQKSNFSENQNIVVSGLV